MTKTSYLINREFIRIPDSSDSIAMVHVTKKEINLIKAMREVKSQDGTYEVQVSTRNYPGGYITYEYHDTFKTDNIQEIEKLKYYKCPNCGKIIDHNEYILDIGYGSIGMCYCEFEEWRILNPFILIDNPNDIPEIKHPKYYKCRNCGTIIDEDEYHREPYSSMCFCEYSPESRILNPFFIIKGDD